MKFLKILVIVILPFISFSQTMNKEVKGKIELSYSEDLVLIKATAENLTDVYKSISYKLSVIKNAGKSGNQSTNAQSGRHAIDPEKIVELSKTQINVNSKDDIVLLLLIYDEKGNIIGKDKIELGEKKNEDKSEKINDGLELSGIISDETKTRDGKDFYDLFYTEYNKINKKGNKIVIVGEEQTIARSTKIIITIENDLITEFLLRPDDEYLSSMAEESASLVFKYFKNLERQNQEIVKY